MSDIGDTFRAHRDHSKAKRAANRCNSTEMLLAARLEMALRNGGAHVIVTAGDWTIDFWPGTGLWIVRGETRKRRGVRSLIRFVQEPRP